MRSFTQTQLTRALAVLVFFHIIVIAASNYLVQIPIQIFGLLTTWGTFTFPLVYLVTDLTVRIFGQTQARKIIFWTLIPALLISYLVSVLFFEGRFQGVGGLAEFNLFVFRIAFASFIAYLAGQLLDIKVFSRLRDHRSWWVAPSASTIVGNLVDTLLFYSIAFWASSDAFMAQNWPEIALLDYCFKIAVSIMLFLPAYGVLLSMLTAAMVPRESR
ncbi:MAG: 7-cyano-7-deazaguanine/7-aminomethyl-7-deazaguanine transporter [Desulfofustis sp.]|nr:7-cyano-7-deazaguanine/7-aminomethyl-7-deazaguanine transporter [Desulfofustis sp.]NNK14217.1 7-cyano-7-deazaguanine/7-aminomethyl-7-deazaguanine transporter [Desulfofustis sp.]NNK56297.1 7-cyano-7-deazaguanine/7-aminomethyl-7-deazaguanine transporter [Desulfofustis sp.]